MDILKKRLRNTTTEVSWNTHSVYGQESLNERMFELMINFKFQKW